MKKLAAATAVALVLGTSAQAGALTDPVIEKTVVVEETTSSSSGAAFVAFLALLLAVPLIAS